MVRMKKLFVAKLEIRINEAEANLHFSLSRWVMATSSSTLTPRCYDVLCHQWGVLTESSCFSNWDATCSSLKYVSERNRWFSLWVCRLPLLILQTPPLAPEGDNRKVDAQFDSFGSTIERRLALCESLLTLQFAQSRHFSLNFKLPRPDANLWWHLLISFYMHF